MNKFIRNFTLAFALIFTLMLFQPVIVNAKEPSSSDTVTITYDLNGGTYTGDSTPNEVVPVGTFELPLRPEMPVDIRYNVLSPEGKWYDAFEVDGIRYEFGEEIEVTEDTTIKYLWKDIIWIHRIDLTLEAPIVGTEVDIYNDDLHTCIQRNNPIVNVPEDAAYYVDYNYSYWYVGEDFDYFEGTIEKNTTYNAAIHIGVNEEGYEFADDIKVFVNGKEVNTFENLHYLGVVEYEIESIENTEEYTLESPTDKIDASISFIEQNGNRYDFDIIEYLAITDEDIQKEVDFCNQYLEDDEKLTFDEVKAELDKVINYGKNAANGNGDLLKLFNLNLYDNGEEIHQVEGGFKFRLKITDDIKEYDTYKLIYIAEDGTTEDAIELAKNEEYLEGTLSHLSMYALVGSNAETTTTVTTNTINNPQTGDNIMFYISMLGLSMISLIGTGIYTKKKVLK